MKTRRPFVARISPGALLLAIAGFIVAPATLHAQKKKANPASKVYVTDVAGEAVIDTGDSVEDIAQRSVYSAQGTVIETRKAGEADKGRAYSTMVYSNGTGAFFDADTRVEVKRFVQEPFQPNRTDIDVEPSISQTQAFLARGAVGLCNSKLVAGSNMVYQTPHGSVNIRGRKVVIEASPQVTKISMLEGESTVRAGASDMGGHTVHTGEQAIIRAESQGQPASVEIVKIPPQETPQLDDKVAMACLAKKTVYFEAKEKKDDSRGQQGGTDGKSGSSSASGDDASTPGPITAFAGNTDDKTPTVELVPVVIVPVQLPVELTLSNARVENPPPKPGN